MAQSFEEMDVSGPTPTTTTHHPSADISSALPVAAATPPPAQQDNDDVMEIDNEAQRAAKRPRARSSSGSVKSLSEKSPARKRVATEHMQSLHGAIQPLHITLSLSSAAHAHIPPSQLGEQFAAMTDELSMVPEQSTEPKPVSEDMEVDSNGMSLHF